MKRKSELLFVSILLLLFYLTKVCHGDSEVKELPLGAIIEESAATPGSTMYYKFQAPNQSSLKAFDSLIIRVVRRSRFTTDTDKMELCLSYSLGSLQGATPALATANALPECKGSESYFEVWMESSFMIPGATYHIGVRTWTSVGFLIESCIGKCQDQCPSDCNGRGGCLRNGGSCVCDATRSKMWIGADCSICKRLILGATIQSFVVFVVFVSCIVGLMPAIWIAICRSGSKKKKKKRVVQMNKPIP